ncbi:MAG: GspH/FimT family pseudopilin [Planctomycetes bacterium]|nr:GspH/FimT family pseudopilin [Planctomycetota bacterium]
MRRSPIRLARRARAGFSLAEILTVIVILGMIATVVTVSWRAILPKSELHSAVRNLSEDLNGTRSEAIGRNAEYRIQYDLDRRAWRIISPFKLDGSGNMAQTEEERLALPWKQLPGSIKFLRIDIDGLSYTQGQCFVRFDALGSTSGHTIVLAQEPENNIYTVEVLGLTGLIRFYEGTFQREPPKDADFR